MSEVITTENGIEIKRYSDRVVIHKIPRTLSGDVILPKEITCIQKDDFVDCEQITSITIQDNVVHIDEGAFDPCINLEKIYVTKDNKCYESDSKGTLYSAGYGWLKRVPQKQSGVYVVSNRVFRIAKGAFKDCKQITTLVLGSFVTSIASGAFQNCTGLLHVTIPSTVTVIDGGAFAGCTQMCGLTASTDSIHFACEDGALFSKNKKVLFYVPATLQGQQGKKDGRYQVPDSVTCIASQAFSGCNKIKEIILPDSLEKMGMNVFEGCSGLETVYAPAGVVRWDRDFDQCKNLKNRFIRDPQGIIYNRDTRKIARVWKQIECANILNGMVAIEPETFANCQKLTTVVIPGTVTSVYGSAFVGCKNLTTIIVSDKSTALYTDEYGVLYEKKRVNNILVRVPTNLADTYYIPEGVTHIAVGAFESCLQLKAVVIPESVWAIQHGAFMDCPDLTICGKPGSEAEIAAKKHAIPFTQI